MKKKRRIAWQLPKNEDKTNNVIFGFHEVRWSQSVSVLIGYLTGPNKMIDGSVDKRGSCDAVRT